MKITADHSA